VISSHRDPAVRPYRGGAHRLPDRGNEAADVYADHRVGLRGETTGSARDARRAGALITTGSAGTSHVRGSFLLTASAEYRSRPPRRRVRVSAPAKRSGTARSCRGGEVERSMSPVPSTQSPGGPLVVAGAMSVEVGGLTVLGPRRLRVTRPVRHHLLRRSAAAVVGGSLQDPQHLDRQLGLGLELQGVIESRSTGQALDLGYQPLALQGPLGRSRFHDGQRQGG
jgi:hypothetical protein